MPQGSSARALRLIVAAGWNACIEDGEKLDSELFDHQAHGDFSDILFTASSGSPAKNGTAVSFVSNSFLFCGLVCVYLYSLSLPMYIYIYINMHIYTYV